MSKANSLQIYVRNTSSIGTTQAFMEEDEARILSCKASQLNSYGLGSLKIKDD